MREKDNRWSKRLLDWYSIHNKYSRKRPDSKWIDEIMEFASKK